MRTERLTPTNQFEVRYDPTVRHARVSPRKHSDSQRDPSRRTWSHKLVRTIPVVFALFIRRLYLCLDRSTVSRSFRCSEGEKRRWGVNDASLERVKFVRVNVQSIERIIHLLRRVVNWHNDSAIDQQPYRYNVLLRQRVIWSIDTVFL